MKNQHGQTLIEVLLSMAVATIIITAITFAVINSLKNSQFSKNQTLATQYTQQGLEIIRSMRYSNYAAYIGTSGIYCLDDSAACSLGVNNTSGGPCGPSTTQCTSANI